MPDRHIAYKDETGTITYQELFNAVLVLAESLIKEIPKNRGQQELVALLLEPNKNEIVSLLGIAFAGHYYLALDPIEDEIQHQKTMANYPFKVLVATNKLKDKAERIVKFSPGCRIIYLEELPDQFEGINFPELNSNSYHTVYFTSGSTGTPRGVIRTHGTGLITAYISATELHICPEDRINFNIGYINWYVSNAYSWCFIEWGDNLPPE